MVMKAQARGNRSERNVQARTYKKCPMYSSNDFNTVFCLPAEQSTRWLLLSAFNSDVQGVSTCVLTRFCQANYKWMKFSFAITYLMLPQWSFGTAAMKPVLPDSCFHQRHSWVSSNCCPSKQLSPEVSSSPACWPAARGPGNGISTNIFRPPASADF